ncbi:MAG: hypothetical protein VKM98_04180 [Cyanobacteriota bacterium]|nr:hypothetical protein [Cyanobacteriota bacterium]
MALLAGWGGQGGAALAALGRSLGDERWCGPTEALPVRLLPATRPGPLQKLEAGWAASVAFTRVEMAPEDFSNIVQISAIKRLEPGHGYLEQCFFSRSGSEGVLSAN